MSMLRLPLAVVRCSDKKCLGSVGVSFEWPKASDGRKPERNGFNPVVLRAQPYRHDCEGCACGLHDSARHRMLKRWRFQTNVTDDDVGLRRCCSADHCQRRLHPATRFRDRMPPLPQERRCFA